MAGDLHSGSLCKKNNQPNTKLYFYNPVCIWLSAITLAVLEEPVVSVRSWQYVKNIKSKMPVYDEKK